MHVMVSSKRECDRVVGRFFIHAPKKAEPEAQQAPRLQWSVRVKQSTAFVQHSKSSGIILTTKIFSLSGTLTLVSSHQSSC